MPAIIMAPSLAVNEVIRLHPGVLDIQTLDGKQTLHIGHPGGAEGTPISTRLLSSKLRQGQVITAVTFNTTALKDEIDPQSCSTESRS